MNTRKMAPSVAAAMVVMAIVLAATLAPAMASQPTDEDPCTIMHPDIEITNSTADQHVSNATGALQLAPLNPDFVAYRKSPLRTSGDYICGYIPPPMDLSHLDDIPVKRLQAPGALPSSFDWRDSGNVTPVKDQASCGTCWTFGTTSVLESAVLINEGAEYNFSEQSVALCVDRSWTYLYDNSTDPCKPGGWGWLAAEVFIRKGSVLESCNPYNTAALNCDGSCVCDDCTPVKRVDGYRLVTNNGSEIDMIKNAVYDHGPVTMSFFVNWSAFDEVEPWGTIHDYYPCSGSANHLVSIIGWNDSVPHPNPAHDGTGAWIVKNSWGTGWGNDGFFYLAYNSSCVHGIAYLEYKDPIPGEELLYWDEAGFVGAVGSGDSSAWMASVFTVDQSGNLTHVDFWTTSNNAEYTIYIRNGFFGSELANQTGICPEYGYYSIPLSTPIPMDAGQQFTVGVNMTTRGYGYPIPVEYEIAGTVSPTIQNNVSFIRQNASDSWTDMETQDWNACLRARMASKLPCTHGDICVNPTGWWCNNGTFNTSGTPIQSAVGNANSGETIYVWNGSYSENVDIGTASLTLQGEGADVVTVNAASSGDHVFDVTANRVNISGFTATGATGPNSAGINLCNADHCNISDNNVTNNDCGISLESSNYTTIANNNASNNVFCGIYLWASNNNTLTSNAANSNNQRGIYLTSSNDNTVTNNTLLDNNWDIYIKSTSSDFTNNTLSGTTISFTCSGDVSLKGVNSPAADPTGRQSIGRFVNVTNQSADAWIFLNFSYSDSDVSELNESSLKVWKHNGISYEDSWNGTRYLNTTANVVGVNITSFSVFAPMVVLPPPDITSYSPETPVSDEPNATRTFNITVDQTVNVTWLINGTIVQDTNTSVTTASYTNTSAAAGVWNVSAVANNANGTDMQTWIWNVAPRVPGDVTGDDVVNIGDAVLLFNWVSFPNERETTYALNRTDNADVTGNGVVNIGDATLLFNWVAFPNERGTTYVLQ